MDKIPSLSTDLISKLNEIYPEKCADPTDTDRAIWQYVGARNLVRTLLDLLKQESQEGELERVLPQED